MTPKRAPKVRETAIRTAPTVERSEATSRGVVGNRTASVLVDEARAGTADPGTRLPHFELLQAAFGARHDLTTITAHIGNRAAAAAHALGAEAYAVGNHVAFEAAPSPALVAHEVAHVVQDRAGIERSADNERVADAVSHGVTERRPIADMLPSPTRVASGATVQLKPKQPAQPQRDTTQLRNREAFLVHYPWLARLANVDEILDRYGEIVAVRNRLYNRGTELHGDISESRAARLEREIGELEARNRKLDDRVPIDITQLLHADALPDPKDPLDVGRQALYADLVRRGAFVQLQPHALDAASATVRVYVNPGWEVVMRLDGVHLDTILAIQQLSVFVYTQAILHKEIQLTEDFMEANPSIYEDLADSLQADLLAQEEVRVSRKEVDIPEVAEIKREHARYAREVREQYAAATAPIAMILEILLPSGPLDLALMVLPVGKIGKGAWNLGKRALQLRKVAKVERELKVAATLGQRVLAELGDEAISFVRLGERVAKTELVAARKLAELGAEYTVIRRLLDQSSRGAVEIEWLAKLAGKKKLDVAMIERITLHESRVPWSDLQKIIEKAPIADGARSSVMSKLVGVLGEEAAEKILQTEKFAEKFGKQPFDKIRRGTRYGVQGSFDLVASHDGNFVFGVFAEVKNWSTATWTSDLTSVLSQLDRHNAGVAEYFKLLGAKANKRTAGKVLMVGDKGFKGLAIEAQETIRAELKTRGWRLEMIPQSMIQTGEAFIDALR